MVEELDVMSDKDLARRIMGSVFGRERVRKRREERAEDKQSDH